MSDSPDPTPDQPEPEPAPPPEQSVTSPAPVRPRRRWLIMGAGLAILGAMLAALLIAVLGGDDEDQARAQERAEEVVEALNAVDIPRLCRMLAPLEKNLLVALDTPPGISDQERIELVDGEDYERCESTFGAGAPRRADLEIVSVEIDDEIDGRKYATLRVSGTVGGDPIPSGSSGEFYDLVEVADQWWLALGRSRPPQLDDQPSDAVDPAP